MAIRGLAAAVLVCGCGLTVQAQDRAPAASPEGVARLTVASRQDALQCGNAGATCAVDPYQLCPEQAALYSIRLITPFSRVASAELDANTNAQPLGRMGPGAVNPWGVALSVSPAEHSTAAAAISRVEIRRDDGTVIQPEWTTLGAITTTIASGATKRLSRGFFVFPVETFAPRGDLKLILLAESGETTCTLDRSQLAALR
jgi:hypothetical protein